MSNFVINHREHVINNVKHITEKEESKFMQKNKCYYLACLKILAENGLRDEYTAFKAEVIKKLKESIKQKSDYPALPYSIMEFSSLQEFLQPGSGNDLAESVRGVLVGAWSRDRQMLVNFHQSKTVRMAKLPNLDGLYGGRPCVRTTDKSNISKHQSTKYIFS